MLNARIQKHQKYQNVIPKQKKPRKIALEHPAQNARGNPNSIPIWMKSRRVSS